MPWISQKEYDSLLSRLDAVEQAQRVLANTDPSHGKLEFVPVKQALYSLLNYLKVDVVSVPASPAGVDIVPREVQRAGTSARGRNK